MHSRARPSQATCWPRSPCSPAGSLCYQARVGVSARTSHLPASGSVLPGADLACRRTSIRSATAPSTASNATNAPSATAITCHCCMPALACDAPGLPHQPKLSKRRDTRAQCMHTVWRTRPAPQHSSPSAAAGCLRAHWRVSTTAAQPCRQIEHLAGLRPPSWPKSGRKVGRGLGSGMRASPSPAGAGQPEGGEAGQVWLASLTPRSATPGKDGHTCARRGQTGASTGGGRRHDVVVAAGVGQTDDGVVGHRLGGVADHQPRCQVVHVVRVGPSDAHAQPGGAHARDARILVVHEYVRGQVVLEALALLPPGRRPRVQYRVLEVHLPHPTRPRQACSSLGGSPVVCPCALLCWPSRPAGYTQSCGPGERVQCCHPGAGQEYMSMPRKPLTHKMRQRSGAAAGTGRDVNLVGLSQPGHAFAHNTMELLCLQLRRHVPACRGPPQKCQPVPSPGITWKASHEAAIVTGAKPANSLTLLTHVCCVGWDQSLTGLAAGNPHARRHCKAGPQQRCAPML